MKKLLIAASAIALFAVPAQAQLLGGSGGLGGMVGGTLGGGFGSMGGTLDSVSSSIGSTLDASGSTSGDQQVDRRSGRVQANRRADANTSASVAPLVDNPVAPLSGEASGSGSAAGQGSADAQLIGTDAVAGLAGQTNGQVLDAASSGQAVAAGLVASAQGTAGQATGTAVPLAGSATGSATGTGNAAGSIGTGLGNSALAVAGSGAANGTGAFAVAPGMDVFGAGGEKIGEVRQVVANSQGTVSEVVVRQDGQNVTYPAAALHGSGSALYAGEGDAAVN
ncbi:hypothetical protein [Alteraurantiacibacter buctensis]|uniref:PRC-barrel domain-containing protein n=1 Tax=Alteraurantiacibacter buctensis TaxID=1503981 RepID=A0A844YT54_9SPHN|nr:hypothetical protein [Alteraurantiacibacter buctensis]MXO70051.1 hypothetical protein [Alteraurantiacibacter buctensis]